MRVFNNFVMDWKTMKVLVLHNFRQQEWEQQEQQQQ